MSITIYGLGFVGKTYAKLLTKKFSVIGFDINFDEAKLVNEVGYSAVRKITSAASSEIGLICLPTNLKNDTNSLDVSNIVHLCKSIHSYNKNQIIIIKSTVPIGTTKRIREILKYDNVFFSPEFLREKHAFEDVCEPDRIIIGGKGTGLIKVIRVLTSDRKGKLLLMNESEAEGVKLFSNAYLALRVSFFNELDMFARSYHLSTKNIIKGVSADTRIGDFYNRVSAGFGGYCLPKDTRELATEFSQRGILNNLSEKCLISNLNRAKYIANAMNNLSYSVIGIYGLGTEANARDLRNSPFINVAKQLQKLKIKVLLYEPSVGVHFLPGITVVRDSRTLFNKCNAIITGTETVFRKNINQIPVYRYKG